MSLPTPSQRFLDRARIKACDLCRVRKVKCDRQQPCSHCVRAESDCIYPTGRGRASKRPRTLDARVAADRLTRLEMIIRRLVNPNATPALSSETTNESTTADGIDEQFGRLMVDETRSCYVSNTLLASLANEIDELRDMLLLEPTSEDESSETSFNITPSLTGSDAAIFGFRSIAASLQSFHPSMSQAVGLFTIFTENVAPLVRIFHMPTISRVYWDSIATGLSLLDKPTEALLFAIYYSAVISMSPAQCQNTLNVTRGVALERNRFAVEQALARGDLLNTQSMTLLQAAVLFLSALRNQDDSRTTWSLTALIYHIAQAMGLHRDGSVFGLKPFETELRRRLWWQICILDNRSSEYHGCEPIIHQFASDTRPPLHINDSDLSIEMTETPVERNEATDMTFCLIRCEAMRTAWKITRGTHHNMLLKDREALVQELDQRLQTKYLVHCDTTMPYLLVSSTVARLIVARFWLMLHYPLGAKRGEDQTMRDKLFLTSIELLELSSLLLNHKDITKWTWYSKTHIQWHAVAFVLSELCSRPVSPDCDRAWACVQSVCNGWSIEESERNSTLWWRPIRRLMAKAQYVREMQQTGPCRTAELFSSHSSSGNVPNNALIDSVQVADSTDNLPNVFGFESLDPWMDLLPDNLQGGFFSPLEFSNAISRGTPCDNHVVNSWDDWHG